MKTKFRRAILALFPLIIIFSAADSQSNPQFGGGGQIVVPTSDFGGSPADFYGGSKYGQSVGVGIHLKTRFDFAEVPLAVTMEYSILRNKGAAESGEIELEHRMFTLKLGPELYLEVGRGVTGYISPNLALHNLGGDITFRGISTLPDTAFIMRAGERLGFGFTTGALIELYPEANLDVSLNYNFINPLNHVWEDAYPDNNKRINSYLSINDAKDPQSGSNHFIQSSRSLQTLQLTITLIFKIQSR